jgi:hypothetical protein
VEGEPIFKYVERTTESDTSQDIFFPAHKDFCMDILDNLDQWLSRKFNGVENIFAFRLDPTAPLHTSKNEQLTSNNITQFNAYAQCIAKKSSSGNRNEAMDKLDRVPARPEKHRTNITYEAALVTPVQ